MADGDIVLPDKKDIQTKKRDLISQNVMPAYSFKRSLDVAKALLDEFGGKSAEPHLLAQALDLSPTSTTWRMLSGSAIAYGLTDAGYNAKKISITPLGKSILMPTEEGEKEKSIIAGVMKPKILNDFFTRYDKAKLPSKDIGINVLKSMGIPFDRAEKAFGVIVENGEYAGIITETKTGPFISVTFNETFIKKDFHDENPIKETDDNITTENGSSTSPSDLETAQIVKTSLKKPSIGGNYSINLNIQLQLPETTNPEVY